MRVAQSRCCWLCCMRTCMRTPRMSKARPSVCMLIHHGALPTWGSLLLLQARCCLHMHASSASSHTALEQRKAHCIQGRPPAPPETRHAQPCQVAGVKPAPLCQVRPQEETYGTPLPQHLTNLAI